MQNRLETLRNEIDVLIETHQCANSRYFISHLFGTSYFCALLALRRGLNPELAATCGMLHDIYQVVPGILTKHGEEGAKQAKSILKKLKLYSDDEIGIITHAISKHSKKRKIHGPYDELLKDADVLSHCLYNLDFPIVDKEVERYNKLLAELGCSPNNNS